MRFLACHDFHTYNSHRLACGFRIVTTSARTSCAGVHALSRLSQFPHVPFLPRYMRFPDCHDFRMYNSCGLHTLFDLSQFLQVLFPREDMRFSTCHDFRTHYFCRGTCGFRIVTISARTISAGRHALSRLSCFSHVLFLSGYMHFSARHVFRTY